MIIHVKVEPKNHCIRKTLTASVIINFKIILFLNFNVTPQILYIALYYVNCFIMTTFIVKYSMILKKLKSQF